MSTKAQKIALNRRHFVMGAASAGAVRHAAGANDRIGLAIIGCGVRGFQAHIKDALALGPASNVEVTAVCDTRDVEIVRSLGAHDVVDRLQADFTGNGETYDVIFDAVGKHSFRRSRRSLKPGGIYVTADLGFLCTNAQCP